MPEYKYKCTKCSTVFREMTSIAGRDDVNCPGCAEQAQRQWEGTTAMRYSHKSNVEKGIHSDLVEANKLERLSAYDAGIRDNEGETKRIQREIDRLKFTD